MSKLDRILPSSKVGKLKEWSIAVFIYIYFYILCFKCLKELFKEAFNVEKPIWIQMDLPRLGKVRVCYVCIAAHVVY